MGKYIEFNRRYVVNTPRADITDFTVTVAIHGKKPHKETYRVPAKDFEKARTSGWLKYGYLDWKPVTGDKIGGIKQVFEYTRDEKYVYAHTNTGIYSLPRYLELNIMDKEQILFGQRIK